MFKTGDKVVCVNNKGAPNVLIENRIYEVLDFVEDNWDGLVQLKEEFGNFGGSRFRLATIQDNLPEAKKDSVGKPSFDILMSIRGLKSVGAVFEYGSRKYEALNWRKAGGDENYKLKLFGAAMRHIYSRIQGERLDKESGLPHMAHAICDLLMILDLDGVE